jgi:hypothetical protein
VVPGTLGAAAALAAAPMLTDRRAQGAPSPDWLQFTSALASVLPELDHGEFLILDSKLRPYYVQFWGDKTSLRVEAVSNQYLPEDDRLSARSHRALLAGGWKAPSREANRSKQDPGGSPNYSMDIRHFVAFSEVAALAVRHVVDVL